MQLLDVSGPLDVFAEANVQSGNSSYALMVIAAEPGPIRSSSGVRLMPDRDSTDIALQARMMFSAVHGIISLGLEERMVAVPPEHLRRQLAQFVDTYLAGLGLAPGS